MLVFSIGKFARRVWRLEVPHPILPARVGDAPDIPRFQSSSKLSLPMASNDGSKSSTRTWKTVSLTVLACTSIYLLYQFTSAAEHVSSMSSRLLDSVSSKVNWGEPSIIEEGIDARLVWDKGPYLQRVCSVMHPVCSQFLAQRESHISYPLTATLFLR